MYMLNISPFQFYSHLLVPPWLAAITNLTRIFFFWQGGGGGGGKKFHFTTLKGQYIVSFPKLSNMTTF